MLYLYFFVLELAYLAQWRQQSPPSYSQAAWFWAFSHCLLPIFSWMQGAENGIIRFWYSKASRYTASRRTDLVGDFDWIPKHLRYMVFGQKPWRCTVFNWVLKHLRYMVFYQKPWRWRGQSQLLSLPSAWGRVKHLRTELCLFVFVWLLPSSRLKLFFLVLSRASHCAFSSNLFHGHIVQIYIDQMRPPENKKCSPGKVFGIKPPSNLTTFEQERP